MCVGVFHSIFEKFQGWLGVKQKYWIWAILHKIKFSDVFVLGVGFWVEGSAPFRSGYVRILNNNVVFKRSNTTRIVYVCEVIGGADVVSSNTCFLFTLLKMSLCKIDFKFTLIYNIRCIITLRRICGTVDSEIASDTSLATFIQQLFTVNCS